MDSFATITFGTPRDVVNVTEGIDKHYVRVSALVGHVTDAIKQQFEYKSAVSRKMYECNDDITCYVYTRDDENQTVLGIYEYVSEACDSFELQIDACNIVKHQSHKHESVEREDIRYNMCMFSPLRPEQTPSHT